MEVVTKTLFNKVAKACVGLALIAFSSTSFSDAALDAFNNDRLDQAKMLFSERLAEPASKDSALYYLAAIDQLEGNFKEAIDTVNRSIDIGQPTARKYILLGNLYAAQAQEASIFFALRLAKKCLSSYEKAYAADNQSVAALIDYHHAAPSIAGGSDVARDRYLAALYELDPDMAKMKEIQVTHQSGETEVSAELADALKSKDDLGLKVRYLLANHFKSTQAFTDAGALYEALLSYPITSDMPREDRWIINDSYLQMGEVLLLSNQQLDRGIDLIKQFQSRNRNPRHVHHLWSYWSLAKLHKAKGDLAGYDALVAEIKSMNYKRNKPFRAEFESATK